MARNGLGSWTSNTPLMSIEHPFWPQAEGMRQCYVAKHQRSLPLAWALPQAVQLEPLDEQTCTGNHDFFADVGSKYPRFSLGTPPHFQQVQHHCHSSSEKCGQRHFWNATDMRPLTKKQTPDPHPRPNITHSVASHLIYPGSFNIPLGYIEWGGGGG